MKYFTPQLWIGFNSIRRKAAFRRWDENLQAYKKNLGTILPALNSQARRFFRDVLALHDGTLTRLEVGDRIGNPLGVGRRGDSNRRKVGLRMFVLSSSYTEVYELEYKDVARVDLGFPGNLKLFPAGPFPNFGDWGYDELTRVSKTLFRHEVLFASGATVVVDFGEFGFRRRRAEKN